MDTNIIYIIAFLGVLGLVFYFFMIRPQRRRQQEHDALMSQLKQGDSVITAGGIYGRVESVAQDSVVLKIESGATMKVAKSSIANKA
ncbi:MAG: preprotein translocase subunit YajC [Chloroflexi bacterium]|nr:preprotein translocase subunit YajC [Chloroflexota bacterium]MCK4697524.1 preprotein translocase subunit YajC [Dehalococcoidia bacterium]